MKHLQRTLISDHFASPGASHESHIVGFCPMSLRRGPPKPAPSGAFCGGMSPAAMASSTRRRNRRRTTSERATMAHETASSSKSVARNVKLERSISLSIYLKFGLRSALFSYRYREEEVVLPLLWFELAVGCSLADVARDVELDDADIVLSVVRVDAQASWGSKEEKACCVALAVRDDHTRHSRPAAERGRPQLISNSDANKPSMRRQKTK